MKYHQGPRFGLSEEEQSLITWKCRCLHRLGEGERERYLDIMREVGRESFPALREYLCTGRTVTGVAMQFYLSESTLQDLATKFFQKAAEKK